MPQGRARTTHAEPGSFGDLLYQLRVEKKLTITELAKRAKVTRPYITALEQGKGLPSPKITRQLADALGVLPIILKMACGQIEFWDLYPVDLEQPPSGYKLSGINKEERIKLLWFLRYLRSVNV
jgi:transcriptional regulator with XRE-family HTH domain